MALDALVWAWDQPLDPATKLVLLVIADNEDAGGRCWITDVERAAKRASVHADAWDAYALLLHALGLVTSWGYDGPRRYYVLSR